MKTKSNVLLNAAVSSLAVLLAGTSYASSHREAPAIAEDPSADNTDLYAWVSPAHDKLYIVANWIPLEEPSGGPNFHKFSDNVRYEINLIRGSGTLRQQIVYRIQFETSSLNYVDAGDLTASVGGGKEFFAQLSGQTQTYTVTKYERGKPTMVLAQGIAVAPVNIGPRTDAVIRGGQPYNDAYAATFIHNMGTEGRVWAGPRDDGFYVDLGGVFDLANLRGPGVAQDGVAGYNTHSIVLEIPTSKLTADGRAPRMGPSNDGLIGIWASSSRKKVQVLRSSSADDGDGQSFGPYVQVSRLGLPLINEAVIGLQDKDKYNRTTPETDVANFAAYFLNPVVVRDAEAVGIYAALGVDPTPFKSNRFDILNVINLKDIPSADAHSVGLEATGDVLRVDIGTDSGFPNGRPITGGAHPNQEQADVTDVLLSLLLAGNPGAGIGDNVNYNDKNFLPDMPFLPLPHRGFDEGHGKPTP